MRKTKDMPSLFEVMGKKAEGRSTPEAVSQPPDHEPPEPALAPLRESPGEAEPTFSVSGDRVRFSLSTLHLALVLFGILLLLLTSYQLGRRSGLRSETSSRSDQLAAQAPDGLEEVRNQLPDPSVLEDLAQAHEQSAHLPQVAPAEGRIAGLNYIWIETVDNYEDAVNARNYLQAEGVPSSVYALTNSKKWVLITTAGFDYDISASRSACDDLLKEIRKIGERYSSEHGRYSFQHCYPRKKKADDNW